MYLIRLALRPWRNHFASQVLSAASVAMLLVLGALLLWMERGLGPVVERLERDQVITAFLDPQLPLAEEKKVADQIRLRVGAKAVEVKSVSGEGFIQELKAHYPDLARELEGLGNEMQALIPRYVTVAGLLDPDAVEKLRTIPGVESAESSRDRYRSVVGAYSALRRVARALSAGILIALAAGLIHLSRGHAQSLSESLGILRLWGAGNLTLRIPGLIAGGTVGLAGGAVAALLWAVGAPWLGQHVASLSPSLASLGVPSAGLAVWLAVAGVGAGVFSGALTPSRSG